jgi:putative membrane protein
VDTQQDRPEREAPSNPNLARDQLANERTLLAWIRTSIAIMGLGFVVARFGLYIGELRQESPRTHATGIATIFGTALVVCGAVLIVLATARYVRTGEGLERNVYRWSPGAAYGLAAIVVAVAALLAIFLVATA